MSDPRSPTDTTTRSTSAEMETQMETQRELHTQCDLGTQLQELQESTMPGGAIEAFSAHLDADSSITTSSIYDAYTSAKDMHEDTRSLGIVDGNHNTIDSTHAYGDDEDLAAALERETEQHIATVEALEEAELQLSKAKHDHQAAREALIKNVRRSRELQEDLTTATAALAAAEELHRNELNEQRLFFMREKESMVLAHEATSNEQRKEIESLRVVLAEMRSQINRMAWTSLHMKKAESMSLTQLFDQLLLAESSGACIGLAVELSKQLQSTSNDTEWLSESGWLDRLMQYTRQLRGGGTSIYACCALASIPLLAQSMLKSPLLEIIDKALFTTDLKYSNPSKVDQAIESAVFATPNEWMDIRRHISLLIQYIIDARGESPVESMEAFVSTPRGLDLLMHTTISECWDSNAPYTDQDTLAAIGNTLTKLCDVIPLLKIESKLLNAGATEALAALVTSTGARNVALNCLYRLCADIESKEALIQQGVLGPMIQLLCQWKRVGDKFTDLWSDIEICLRLLSILSRVDTFAPAFVALDGQSVVVQLIEGCTRERPDIQSLGGEVLVNMLFVAPETAESLLTPRSTLVRLVLENTLMVTSVDALKSRSLEVLSKLITADAKAVNAVTRDSMTFFGNFIVREESSLAYKATFFLYVFCVEGGPVPHLACPAIVAALDHIKISKGSEMLLWASLILRDLTKISLDMRDVPYAIQLEPEDRKLLTTIIQDLAVAEINDPISERHKFLVEARLLWLLYISEMNSHEVDLLRLKPDQYVRWSELMQTLSSTPATLNLIARITSLPQAFDCTAVMSKHLLNVLHDELRSNENQPTPTTELIADTVSVVLENSSIIRSTNPIAVVAIPRTDFIEVVTEVCNVHPSHHVVDAVLENMSSDHWALEVFADNDHGILPILYKVVCVDNRNFAKGSSIAMQLANSGRYDWLWKAGAPLFIHLLRFSRDKDVKSSMSQLLPIMFKNCNESDLVSMRHNATLGHLCVLIETSTSLAELQTGLCVMNSLLQYKPLAISFVRHGGLRVLVELIAVQQGNQTSSYDDALTCLGLVLGCVSKEMVRSIADEGAVGVMLEILRSIEDLTIVSLALQMMAMLTDTMAAQEIYSAEGTRLLSKWMDPSSSIRANEKEASSWARKAIVNLSWNSRATEGRTPYQTLNTIVNEGGLTAWIHALGVTDDVEQTRRSLWAITTWLSVEDQSNKLLIIKEHGLVPLLTVEKCSKSTEVQRYARLSLGKILCAAGDELSMRIQLLQSQMNTSNNFDDLVEEICTEFINETRDSKDVA